MELKLEDGVEFILSERKAFRARGDVVEYLNSTHNISLVPDEYLGKSLGQNLYKMGLFLATINRHLQICLGRRHVASAIFIKIIGD